MRTANVLLRSESGEFVGGGLLLLESAACTAERWWGWVRYGAVCL